MTADIIIAFNILTLLAMVMLLAWIARKQAQLSRVLYLLEQNTNSIKDALIVAVAARSHAEGVLEGKAEREKK